MRAALALAFALASAGAPAEACRLALALAVDVSSSVDEAEHALQREGLAAALEDPEVSAAALSPPGGVLISVYEWSGIGRQTLLVGWTRLEGPADLRAVAALLRVAPRSETRFPTALGDALAYGAALLGAAPPCDRRVIDVSGDGSRNEGPDPRTVYAAPAFDGVEVNALVIGAAARPGLLRYFERFVIRGPDAFAEPADDYRDYPRAIRRKLLRELRPMVFGAVR